MPIPKNANPVAHRARRSTNFSRRGRLVVGMCIRCHRTHFGSTHKTTFSSLHRDALVTLAYEGETRRSVLSLKYANDRRLARWMGCHIASLVQERQIVVGCVTWIPTTSRRRRQRGFDQSRLIAHHVGRYLEVPVVRTLRRLDRIAQTGHDRRHRLRAPRFSARSPKHDGCVVLVDDVITTGATMRSAVECLVEAGVARHEVMCVALAATPSP